MAYIFGYGSLMWRPDFDYTQKFEGAVLLNYHREYNKKSTVEWGTSANPAPTMGLENGGQCAGVCFQVDDNQLKVALNKLKKREGKTFADSFTGNPQGNVKIGRQTVKAYFPLNKRNKTYIPPSVSLEKRAEMVMVAKGKSGTGIEYVRKNLFDLESRGIKDKNLEQMWTEVSKLLGEHKIPVTLQSFKAETIEKAKRDLGIVKPVIVGLSPSIRRMAGVRPGDTITLIGPRHLVGHKHAEPIVVRANEGKIPLTANTRKLVGINKSWVKKTVEIHVLKGMVEFMQVVE
jgi:glutathione-specific gamma-glutamylcyclotransferase